MKIEKAIAAALEPIVDFVAALDSRLRALEAPTTIEVPIDDVTTALKADADFCESVRGPAGEAVPLDLSPLDTIAESIAVLDTRLKTLEAPTSIEVPIDEVAAALKADAEFIESVKGLPGDPGKTPEIDYFRLETNVAKLLPVPRDGVDGIGCNVKEWTPGIYREGATVQHDMGRMARAKCDTAAPPGTNDDWERIGSGGFRWCGVKNDARTYEHGDFYIDDGTTFLVLDGSPRMFCRKGRDGKNGTNGTDGKDASALIGELKIWPGNDAPPGYLLADGAAIPAGDEYDALRAIVGESTPDYSSEFLISETTKGVYVATFIIRAFLT